MDRSLGVGRGGCVGAFGVLPARNEAEKVEELSLDCRDAGRGDCGGYGPEREGGLELELYNDEGFFFTGDGEGGICDSVSTVLSERDCIEDFRDGLGLGMPLPS